MSASEPSLISHSETAAALSSVTARVLSILAEVGSDKFPVYRDPGQPWCATREWNWSSGYWVGLLLLASRRTGSPERERLEQVATNLAVRVSSTKRRNNIFYGLNAQIAGFEAFDHVDDHRLYQFGLSGARAMVDLFDERAQQIPIGSHTTVGINPRAADRDGISFDRRHVAAVDVIHTSVPVLWRAWKETGEPRFFDVARLHCERHLAWHVRDDGGIDQKTAFSPDDGRPLRTFSPLAASDDGCWARGLAWHIAGTLEAHEMTGDRRYLRSVERSLDFYKRHTDEHAIPRFDCLAHSGPLDTSAAAIVAWGLSRFVDPSEPSGGSLGAAIVAGLVRNHLDDSGALLDGCYSVSSRTATRSEFIPGEYYLAMALERMVTSSQS